MEKKKKSSSNVKFVFLTLMCVVIIIVSVLFVIYVMNKDNRNKTLYTIDSRVQDLEVYRVADAVLSGWIKIPGTDIDYPVIYETGEAFNSGIDYLWAPTVTSLTRGENRMSIYGHNVRNVSSSPIINDPEHTRFEQLMGYVYEDFMKTHQYIQFTRDGVDYFYKVYAVGFVKYSDDIGEITESNEEAKNYIDSAIKNSLYKLDVEVSPSDDLISLFTCTRYFGADANIQFRVDARRVREDEKIVKYNVETTENYDIIK